MKTIFAILLSILMLSVSCNGVRITDFTNDEEDEYPLVETDGYSDIKFVVKVYDGGRLITTSKFNDNRTTYFDIKSYVNSLDKTTFTKCIVDKYGSYYSTLYP